ncbi:MAG: hypothetical protein GYA17_12460 [Chloroflexi bacterium]|nr:hypothetical protein [Chloroflexota bacterium]
MKYWVFSVRIWLALVILAALVAPAGTVRAASNRQENDPRQQAQATLARMTPEEKVGQLFLVTFDGSDVGVGSQIYDLIVNHHVGGVVLSSDNDNFTGPQNTVESAYQLISQLQQNAWLGAQPGTPGAATSEGGVAQYVPLFIGISQEGDGYPYDQILTGMTPLPNQMAIGATWNPELAQKVGEVLGSELSRLGINLLLGPDLDVLDTVNIEGDDLGTRTFGGDPYWVGSMGSAYIDGVHSGSENRVALISKHFPGRGGSDRSPTEEVATVRKSLEQLKQIELAPFFAVTNNQAPAEAQTDGLLVSHIRYQGFQGNIRATTRPISFDAAAFEQIMGLAPLSTWRQNGGVVVSDDLGSRAVRMFYDPTGQTFDGRQVARNAFLAGNDLLYLGDFSSTGDPDSYTSTLRALDYFTLKYREDASFAQRVDLSVTRLLQLKYKMYPSFSIDSVIPVQEGLAEIGGSESVTFEVAQKAATLLSPDQQGLEVTVPNPPSAQDHIVFFTDVIEERQCSRCTAQIPMAVDALQSAVARLYGPQSSGQIYQYNLSSYSFADLDRFLAGNTEDSQLEDEIRQANWLVFAILNVQQDRPASSALQQFLTQRPDLLGSKRIVVFSFNAPYYLDATNISKLAAYYGLYSKEPAFVDVAARLLFQEISPTGSSPVSVPGIGYDMITATSPDPDQVIQLYVDNLTSQDSSPAVTPVITTVTPTIVPMFNVGDTIPLRTGVIVDHNGHTVPDGTVARFQIVIGGEGSTAQQIETVTADGIARANYRIQAPGLYEIRVVSDPASVSALLRLDVSTGGAAVVTSIAPTSMPTETEQPTITPQPSPTATPTTAPVSPVSPGAGEWLLSMLIIWGGAGGILWFGSQRINLRWGVRWALLASLGGLAAYILYLLIGFQLEKFWLGESGLAGLVGIILLGIFAGWAGGWAWQRWTLHHPDTGQELRK